MQNAKAPIPFRAHAGIFFRSAIGIGQGDIEIAFFDLVINAIVNGLRIAAILTPTQQAAGEQNRKTKWIEEIVP